MRATRRLRYVLLGLFLYAIFCAVGGVYLADGTRHPGRRPLTEDESVAVRQRARQLDADVQDVCITAPDGAVLRAWTVRPKDGNGSAVILLHGLGDNRVGTTGYGQLLVGYGYTVLMPDARAHGVSGGALATYGVRERDDVHQWFDFLEAKEHPRCIFGFGESMGASQLLQSLDTGIRFCAVAVESPFANFREIAYDRMGQPFHLGPWVGRTLLWPMVEVAFLRARWKYGLDMQQISPEDSVAATRIPVLLIHGQVDSNIPVRHSRLIHKRAPETQLWEVPGADHCGAISTAPEEFDRRLLGWFGSHSAVPGTPPQRLKPAAGSPT
jgi:pimeloyl-ACP methyl ester carboxylesterase